MVEVVERTTALVGLRPGGADPFGAIGAVVPEMGRFTVTDGLLLARVAPHQVLAMRDGADVPLMEELAPLAGVIDVSDRSVAVRVGGARLGELVPLDLHPSRFGPGSCAQTLVAHLSVLLLQTGPDEYELHCGRSFAGSFLRALEGVA